MLQHLRIDVAAVAAVCTDVHNSYRRWSKCGKELVLFTTTATDADRTVVKNWYCSHLPQQLHSLIGPWSRTGTVLIYHNSYRRWSNRGQELVLFTTTATDTDRTVVKNWYCLPQQLQTLIGPWPRTGTAYHNSYRRWSDRDQELVLL